MLPVGLVRQCVRTSALGRINKNSSDAGLHQVTSGSRQAGNGQAVGTGQSRISPVTPECLATLGVGPCATCHWIVPSAPHPPLCNCGVDTPGLGVGEQRPAAHCHWLQRQCRVGVCGAGAALVAPVASAVELTAGQRDHWITLFHPSRVREKGCGKRSAVSPVWAHAGFAQARFRKAEKKPQELWATECGCPQGHQLLKTENGKRRKGTQRGRWFCSGPCQGLPAVGQFPSEAFPRSQRRVLPLLHPPRRNRIGRTLRRPHQRQTDSR